MSGSITTTRTRSNVSGHCGRRSTSSVAQPAQRHDHGHAGDDRRCTSPPERPTTVHGHDQRRRRLDRPVLRPDHADAPGRRLEQRHDPGRVRRRSRARSRSRHTCSPDEPRAPSTDSPHCTVDRDEHRDGRPRTRRLTVTNQDAAKLDFKNITAPGSPINSDNGVQWSGTAQRRRRAEDRVASRTSPATGRPAATSRSPALGVPPIADGRRRHDLELHRARRSTTAVSRTPRSASARTATS